jgi:hypothetical protein
MAAREPVFGLVQHDPDPAGDLGDLHAGHCGGAVVAEFGLGCRQPERVPRYRGGKRGRRGDRGLLGHDPRAVASVHLRLLSGGCLLAARAGLWPAVRGDGAGAVRRAEEEPVADPWRGGGVPAADAVADHGTAACGGAGSGSGDRVGGGGAGGAGAAVVVHGALSGAVLLAAVGRPGLDADHRHAGLCGDGRGLSGAGGAAWGRPLRR